MVIFIGGDISIAASSLISIIDYDNFNKGYNEQLLEQYKSKNLFIDMTEGNDKKSVVITDKFIYISHIAVNTLRKRANKFKGENFLNE